MTAKLPKQRLGVIFGGRSGEHEVSVVSAQHVMAAVDRSRFDVVPIGVTKTGAWLTPEETQAQMDVPAAPSRRRSALANAEGLLARPEALSVLSEIDVAFPLIHGPTGEDGTLQGLLELARVPYAGAGVAASATGLDKALMKALLHDAGLPVVDWLVVNAFAVGGRSTGDNLERRADSFLPLLHQAGERRQQRGHREGALP